MSKLYKLDALLGSEFSCPDTEAVPLKTTENPHACRGAGFENCVWSGIVAYAGDGSNSK